jgi:Undecaprenyl-phosphate glucose phosphotransferase
MNISFGTPGVLADRAGGPMASRPLASLASDLLPLGDFLCLFGAAALSTLLYTHWFMPAGVGHAMHSDFTQAALVAAVLAPFILYDKRFGAVASRGQMPALMRGHALRFSMLALMVTLLGALGQALEDFPPRWLALWLASSFVLTSLTRAVMGQYVRRLQRQGALAEVVAVVGAGPVADRLVHSLRQTRSESIELLGIFDDRVDRLEPGSTPPGGSIEQLIELGKTRKIDWILLTLPPMAEHRLQTLVQRLKALSVPIGLCPQHVSLALPYHTIDYVGDGVPVGLLADRPIKRWDAVVKAAEDLLIGGIVTLLLLPLLAVVAVAVKVSSPGPVLFKQRRHALDNHEFDIYKFRTMRWNPPTAGEGLQQTARNDSRITPLGHFLRSSSLDELPQLFNVLRGDMSLVGPRPHATNMRTEDRLGSDITDTYAHRHRVKPGITGWAQVNGARGATDTTGQLHRRVELDLYYITHWSLWLDLKILALTSRVVVQRTNAF